MKEKAPAFQFYPADFLSSSKVARMTLTEIGAYTVLLCHAWLDDGLPTQVPEIAKLVRMSPARFEKLWAGALSECFQECDGKLLNIRLERERDKQASRRSRQALNGALGGRPRKTHGFSHGNPGGDGDEDSLSSLEEKRDADFESFWVRYPRKDGKQGARVEWHRIDPDEAAQRQIAADVDLRSRGPQWTKDGGQFIPHAKTYLHQRRWEDGYTEPEAAALSATVADPMKAWLEGKAVGHE